MESIKPVHILLLISIFILYIAIKSKTLQCVDIKVSPEPDQKIQVRVSDIFRSMFQDAEPTPGNIGLF